MPPRTAPVSRRVVMLTNVSLPADAFSLDGIRAVLALEGHTLTLLAPMTLEQSTGNLTIRDSTSSGKITGQALTVKGGRPDGGGRLL